jgi:hypothetical protein
MILSVQYTTHNAVISFYKLTDKFKSEHFPFFLICAVELWVLRPLLAYCTSPG